MTENTVQITESKSGLSLVKYPSTIKKEKQEERKYGLLELRGEYSRKEAMDAFHVLRNLSEVKGGGIWVNHREEQSLLNKLVINLQEIMLGDWDCEILC